MEVHYPFPPDKLLPRPIYVSYVGYGKGDNYYHARERGANSLAFEYVVEGSVEATINSLSYRPGPGDVYLLQPLASFEVRDCGEKWHKLWFVVEGQLMESLLSAYGLSNAHYIAQCPVRPTFERMLELAASSDIDKDTVQDHLVVVFYEALLQISTIVTKRGVIIPDDVLRVKNYLDSRIESQVSLLELCEMVKKSKAHVIRTFRRAIGVTPYAYFLDRKIAHAKILLAYSSTKVKQVAENLGFSDEYYFSNVFKQKTGLSPTAYRREKAGGDESLSGTWVIQGVIVKNLICQMGVILDAACVIYSRRSRSRDNSSLCALRRDVFSKHVAACLFILAACTSAWPWTICAEVGCDVQSQSGYIIQPAQDPATI